MAGTGLGCNVFLNTVRDTWAGQPDTFPEGQAHGTRRHFSLRSGPQRRPPPTVLPMSVWVLVEARDGDENLPSREAAEPEVLREALRAPPPALRGPREEGARGFPQRRRAPRADHTCETTGRWRAVRKASWCEGSVEGQGWAQGKQAPPPTPGKEEGGFKAAPGPHLPCGPWLIGQAGGRHRCGGVKASPLRALTPHL